MCQKIGWFAESSVSVLKEGWFSGSSHSASKDWVVCWEQPQCVERLGGLLGAASVYQKIGPPHYVERLGSLLGAAALC